MAQKPDSGAGSQAGAQRSTQKRKRTGSAATDRHDKALRDIFKRDKPKPSNVPKDKNGTLTDADTRAVTVGGVTVTFRRFGSDVVVRMRDKNGRTIEVPKHARFDEKNGTVRLSGGEFLTFSGGSVTRNTPEPKKNSAGQQTSERTFRNPYTGPDQRVNRDNGRVAGSPAP